MYDFTQGVNEVEMGNDPRWMRATRRVKNHLFAEDRARSTVPLAILGAHAQSGGVFGKSFGPGGAVPRGEAI